MNFVLHSLVRIKRLKVSSPFNLLTENLQFAKPFLCKNFVAGFPPCLSPPPPTQHYPTKAQPTSSPPGSPTWISSWISNHTTTFYDIAIVPTTSITIQTMHYAQLIIDWKLSELASFPPID